MYDDEDRVEIRPRMGKRPRARERVATGPLHLAMRIRSGHGRTTHTRRAASLAPSGGFGPRRNARRVVVKAHVQRLGARGAQAAARHLRYIERDGVEKDGSPGALYGPEGPVSRERFEQPRLEERHQFRFIISPEDGRELELTDYVRRLMSRVERDLGRPLEWAAVNHHDTEHPHAHVVIRGIDLEGRPLRIPRAYMARGFRWGAQDVATELLGPRLEREIRRTWDREVTQERFTSLDRELERAADAGRVVVAQIAPREGEPGASLLERRLSQLRDFGLAQRAGDGVWMLSENWQGELRSRGERGDVLKGMHRAMGATEPAKFHVVRPGQGLPDGRGGIEERAMVGRIARIGLADEEKGTFYALVETSTGAAYHLPIAATHVDRVRSGAVVSFRTRPEQAVHTVTDRAIAEVASRQRGIVVADGGPGRSEAERKVAARLRQLERKGVVAARGPHEWTVPPDLVERVQRLERDAPARYRLSIEPLPLSLEAQVTRHGPVWLDTVQTDVVARTGFGAEVGAAMERRQAFLRSLGVQPDDPQRESKLRELERRAIGAERARATKQQFLETAPERFRGRLEYASQSRGYVAISDGARFVLLPAASQWRSLEGKSVEVRRDGMSWRIELRSRDRGLER